MTANMPTGVPPGVPESLITPQGNVPAIGIGTSQDYARLVYAAPYFTTVAIAEVIQPSVTEAVENVLPSLVPPYVDNAVLTGIQQYAVLLTGSTMSGPLFLNPLMPTADAQAATKAYVDTMLATAGIPEVPPVPSGQIWARETGQWVPISQTEGTFLPLSGGIMAGQINMSGNTISNMAAVPAMPNGAAPAQWVLNQIASVSLYQGTWNADTNVPDLTQLSTHVNAYTWIALTTSPSGVVIGEAIPGLQGMTVFNGDTIIYSTVAGAFSAIHAGGITLPEADGRYVQLAGSQMSGALLLNANASQPLQATTFQQLEAAVANTVTPDAPADGQAYLRVGVGANRWVPGLPLAGGILTGALTLSGPGASGNNAVTVAQLNSAISAAQAGFMPIAGGTFTGAVVLNGNATVNLNPVPLQQVNAMLANYATTAMLANYLPLAGGTLTGALIGTAGTFSGTVTAGTLTTSGNVNLSNGGVAFAPLGSGGYQINGGGYQFAAVTTANPIWRWQVSGSPVMVLDNGGNLTCYGTGTTLYGLIVHAAGIQYPNAGDGVSATHQIAMPWNGGTGSIYGYVDGSQIGAIQMQPSDQNLKDNLEPVTVDCLAILDQFALRQFDWKPLEVGSETVQKPHWSCGYIAQDVQTLIPEAVNAGPEGLFSVDMMPLLAYCIGAIQQLSSRLGALDGKTA